MQTEPLEQLQAHVRYRLAGQVQYAQAWRVDELTALVVRYWPHRHLEAIRPSGRNHAAIGHAMRLVKAQVREHWEAERGIGPMWGLVLERVVDGASICLLDLWFSSDMWRCSLRAMARKIGR